MIFVLSFVAFLAVSFALAVFFWIWWSEPRSQVPPHLKDDELRRIEVQDRLRQTNFQILTALGLGFTFLVTVTQLTLTSNQWSEDYQLRTTQERLGRYADALKSLDGGKSAPATISGVWALFNLASQDPANYNFQVNEVLSNLVRRRALEEGVQRSGECQDVGSKAAVDPVILKYERSEAPPDVQAAMSVLGDPKFAMHRQKFLSGACEVRTASRRDPTVLRLDHRYLDELDLNRLDFSCADLSQSHFRRTNFNSAILRGADLGGARIADFEVPGYPEDRIGPNLYHPEKDGGPPDWMLYRCWEADFRGADLTGVNFQGAALSGADFRAATLTDADFCRADVSRANFEMPPEQKAQLERKDLPPKQKDQLQRDERKRKAQLGKLLADACVGPTTDYPYDVPNAFRDAQPFGLDFLIPQCTPDKICAAVR